MSQTIEVLIRVRPSTSSSNNHNNNDNNNLLIDEEQGKVYVPRPKNKTQAEFTFTKVYGPNSDQQYIYSGCNVTEHVMNGINCCIMTYGQTNTGKTYTMYGKGWENTTTTADPLGMTNKSTVPFSQKQGASMTQSQPFDTTLNDDQSITSNHDGNNPDSDNDSVLPMNDPLKETSSSSSSESLGIIPRCIADLFETLERECESNPGFIYSVSCQILQIYNEKIYDLLTDKKRKNPLPLREFGSNHHQSQANNQQSSTVYVRGISVYQIDSKEEAFHLIKKSMKNKVIRATDFNNISSRSHTVVQFFVSIEEEEEGSGSRGKNGGNSNEGGLKIIRRSTLSLIDLAGSEKWRPSLSVNGVAETEAQVKEMTNINTSLHVLGNCIAKLIETVPSNTPALDSRGNTMANKHIPFRDSVLTRLLQNTLSGNGKSIIVATIHSDTDYMEENYSTLQFASRASKVKVTLTANVGITEQISLVEAQRHIKLLQQQLQELKANNGVSAVGPSLRNNGGGEGGMIPMTVTVGECSQCEGFKDRLEQLESRMVEIEQENKKLKEKNKKLRDQIRHLHEQPPPMQAQQYQQPPSQYQYQQQPPSYSTIANNTASYESASYPNTYSTAHTSQNVYPPSTIMSYNSTATLPGSEGINNSAKKGGTVASSITSQPNNTAPAYQQIPTLIPQWFTPQANSVTSAYQQPLPTSSIASSFQQQTASFSSLQPQVVSSTFSNKKTKKKVKSAKCAKHGLEECVLCAMFGGNDDGNDEEEEDENDNVVHRTDQSKQFVSSVSAFNPTASFASSGHIYEKPASSSAFNTPLHTDRKPSPGGLDLPYSRTILTPMTGESTSRSRDEYDRDGASSRQNNLCKTHSLRNCLLCTPEFTFQKEVQMSHTMDSLAKKTNAIINMPLSMSSNSGSAHNLLTSTNLNTLTKLTPLYEHPGIESASTTTASTFVTMAGKSSHLPHVGGGGIGGEMTMARTGFVSTLDSLESSQVDYAFTDNMKNSLPLKQLPSNASSLTSSLTTLKSAAVVKPSGGGSLVSNSSHDVAKAAILAANSLLNSKEFNGARLTSIPSLPNSEGIKGESEEGFDDDVMMQSSAYNGVKSKRLRELKALSTNNTIGNTTSPAILETVNYSYPSSINQQNNNTHLAPAMLPRRSSTSPAPNHSIPIEPIHIHQNNYNKPPIDHQYYQQHHPPASHYDTDPLDDDEDDLDGDDEEDDDAVDTDDTYNNHHNNQPNQQQQRQPAGQKASNKHSNERSITPSQKTLNRPSSRTKSNNSEKDPTNSTKKIKKVKKKKKKIIGSDGHVVSTNKRK
eukprot:CAMPEP_0173154414 /NCGR_PEP_ID=MMETSP1105-20130129/13468_1 /TAXON_ID=2985 /ORGANISM="Ochromonas sp., Strain BG-1" /LENGTH=1305 /DNA_ID=CAMNT_0014070589 /DNA_START=8 /DNA_END=3926 /DNA_ORIENTATION=+